LLSAILSREPENQRHALEPSMTNSKTFLPEPLYESQPYLYMVCGLLAMMSLPNIPATAFGLVLFTSGLVVWQMRNRYRQAIGWGDRKQRSGVQHVRAEVAKTLYEVSWRDNFKCGHAQLDAQHLRLFGLANELVQAAQRPVAAAALKQMIDDLIEHVKDHFCAEEIYLAQAGQSMSRQHREAHRQLLSQAADRRERFQQGRIAVRELVGFLAYDLITNHVIGEDAH
jgi:hemerythrin